MEMNKKMNSETKYWEVRSSTSEDHVTSEPVESGLRSTETFAVGEDFTKATLSVEYEHADMMMTEKGKNFEESIIHDNQEIKTHESVESKTDIIPYSNDVTDDRENMKEWNGDSLQTVNVSDEKLTHDFIVDGSVHGQDTNVIADSEEIEQNPWTIDYDFSEPKMIVKEVNVFSDIENNYLKNCKWSPDGSCLLTNANDNKLRLFNLPSALWTKDYSEIHDFDVALTLSEGGLVYDYCWYPMMSSQNPDTCVLASTGRGLPVHLWDAFTGEIRCVYRPYDHMDELISAKSISFNRCGEKLYCGFEKQIRVFDISRPGRECQTFDYKSTKKRQVRGQSGIMSSFSFHQDDTLFAVGTYGKSVGLYATETGKCVNILRGHASGVTQVHFLPNGNHLISGTRKDNEIFCWDIRLTRAPVLRFERDVKTNQRMQFSTDRSGRYLASGNHDGKLTIWDIEGNPIEDSDLIPPIREVAAHEDTLNGVDMHPFLPIIATASGQHHNDVMFNSSGSDVDSDCEDDEVLVDSSVKLWWVGSYTTKMDCDEIDQN